MQDRLGQLTINELCAMLDSHRIAYGRVSTMADLMEHRSVAKALVGTPEGEIELLAPPVLWDGKRHELGRVPRLGEHTQALKTEFGLGTPTDNRTRKPA